MLPFVNMDMIQFLAPGSVLRALIRHRPHPCALLLPTGNIRRAVHHLRNQVPVYCVARIFQRIRRTLAVLVTTVNSRRTAYPPTIWTLIAQRIVEFRMCRDCVVGITVHVCGRSARVAHTQGHVVHGCRTVRDEYRYGRFQCGR